MSDRYRVLDQLEERGARKVYKILGKASRSDQHTTIKDDSDRVVFNVREEEWSLRDEIDLKNPEGKIVMKIREEIAHLRQTWKIFSDDDRQLALIKKTLSLHEKFLVDSIYGQYIFEADRFLGKLLTMKRNDRLVALMKRQRFSTSDEVELEIDGEENQAMILSIVIAVYRALYFY